MDSSDEESSESSSSDESPAVKKPELKTTGSKEKPQPVKVQKHQNLSLLLLANLRKYLYLHQHQNDSTVGFIKDLKHPRTTIEMKKPILLLPTKPKKKFSRIFDSSDDDSSESESDSDSEVPMSQLKVGRAPNVLHKLQSRQLKVIPPPVMIAVMMVVKVVVMIVVLVTAPATAAPVTAALVRKVPAIKVVRFIMHVNLIRQSYT